MNGRVYDPNLGRFMSVDPFIGDKASSQAINPYSYGLNNPLSGTDPTGYIWDTVWDAASVVYDVGKIGYGYATGNPAIVAEGAVDLAADTIALATPFVPAGSTKLARITMEGVDKVKDIEKAADKTKDAQKLRQADNGKSPDTSSPEKNIDKAQDTPKDGKSTDSGAESKQPNASEKTDSTSDIGSQNNTSREKTHGNSVKSEKPTQHYTHTDQDGKSYHGVGDVDGKRAAQSLKRLEKANPDKQFTTQKTNYPNRAEAYKAEDKGIQSDGGPKGAKSYNEINSPGKKLNEIEVEK
jgi:hypothetical protein